MGEEEQQDPGKKKGSLPKFSAIHIVIIIGVIVVGAIFVAKFGFGMDLISPSSGEMAIAKRPVTPVQTIVQTPEVRPTISFRPETLCPANQTLCGNTCTNRMTDPDHCGFCGKVCPSYASANRTCSSAKCGYSCLPAYADCNNDPSDGCEVDLANDAKNCGHCGRDCGGDKTCSYQHCSITIGTPGPEPYHPPQQWEIQ